MAKVEPFIKAYYISGPFDLHDVTMHQHRIEDIINDLVDGTMGEVDADDFTVTEVELGLLAVLSESRN